MSFYSNRIDKPHSLNLFHVCKPIGSIISVAKLSKQAQGRSIITYLHIMEDNEKKIRVLCLGPKGSGKTTLLKKLQDPEGIDYTFSPVPTIGTNIYDITYLNKQGKKQIVSVREVGGEMAVLWTNYLDGVEKIIFVVDTSNLCQISEAAVMLYTLLAEPRLFKAKFFLVLSKMDAAYRQMRNEALLMLQHARLCRELRARTAPVVVEASPLTGDGMDNLKALLAEPKPRVIKPKI